MDISIHTRGLVRTGATGASAPAEIRQRVRRTRPEDSELVNKSQFGVKIPISKVLVPRVFCVYGFGHPKTKYHYKNSIIFGIFSFKRTLSAPEDGCGVPVA